MKNDKKNSPNRWLAIVREVHNQRWEYDDAFHLYSSSYVEAEGPVITQRELGASFFFFQASICTGFCEQLLQSLVRVSSAPVATAAELRCTILLLRTAAPEPSYAPSHARRESPKAQYSALISSEVWGKGFTRDAGALGGS